MKNLLIRSARNCAIFVALAAAAAAVASTYKSQDTQCHEADEFPCPNEDHPADCWISETNGSVPDCVAYCPGPSQFTTPSTGTCYWVAWHSSDPNPGIGNQVP